MSNTESIKLHLISQIALLDDAKVLAQLEDILVKNPSKNKNILKKLSTPRKNILDIEQLKNEQNFTQFNRTRFDQLIKELNIKEPIEQLLKMI